MMTRKQLVTTLTLACCVCVSAPTAKSAPPGTPEADELIRRTYRSGWNLTLPPGVKTI